MKKFGLVIAGIFLILPFTADAFSSHEGCGGDCMQCHRLEKKEAEKVVNKLKDAKNIPASAQVKDVKLSPVGGLWQIDIEVAEGKRGALYLDFSKKNLIVGQIVPVEAIGKAAPPKKVDFSKIPLGDALVMGPKTAKKKVVVFTDPDCPFCRKLHEEMKQVLGKRNDVAFYIILYPLPMHKDAEKKSQAILCERSLEILDDAFAGKAVPEPTCTNDQLEKNKALAKSLEFSGTPTLVRSDGMVTFGVLQADKLSEWIDGKK